MPICQMDLPLDWYQEEFKPYAEEYLALESRAPEVVLPWMDSYIRPALDHFGPRLMLLAHYYMGGEIVKLVERYGGKVADSYLLARQAVLHPDTKIFVESAVHFMAEAIAILAAPDQEVYITNPKAGCTMEMLAKEHMVLPAFDYLVERFGDELLGIAYMNTSGRLKALAGQTGGACCTSSHAEKVVRWASKLGKRIFSLPYQHLGDNVARQVGIDPARIFRWPGGLEGMHYVPSGADEERLDRAEMILWGAFCGVHTVFSISQIEYWRARGHRVLVHPECTKEVVAAADGNGSTNYLWNEVMKAPAGAKLAIGTEAHFVKNAREQGRLRGVEVVNLADIPEADRGSAGCGCATMSRNDPPHLVAMLDLLRKGTPPSLNRVLAGDVVNERTGWRERMHDADRAALVRHARASLERMIEVTEASPG
ncbi:MAG: quinolinate synthase NadA [Deltaproteobacteria bacterium]|nr:quinolinate synthase NadA [Deltaproteobacteria bacterium]